MRESSRESKVDTGRSPVDSPCGAFFFLFKWTTPRRRRCVVARRPLPTGDAGPFIVRARSSFDRHSIVARSSLDRRRRADRRGTRDPSGVIQSSFVMIWLLHVKMVNEDYLKAVDSLLLVECFKKWLKCGKMFWQRFGYWWTLLHYWSGTNFACCNRDFFSIEKIKCHDSSFRWIARASGTMALVDGPDFTRKVYCPFVLFLFFFLFHFCRRSRTLVIRTHDRRAETTLWLGLASFALASMFVCVCVLTGLNGCSIA